MLHRAQRLDAAPLLSRTCPLPVLGLRRPREPAAAPDIAAAAAAEEETVVEEAAVGEVASAAMAWAMPNPPNGINQPHPSAVATPPLPDLQTLIGMYVPHAAVTSFVWAVLVKVIPPPLLGDAAATAGLRATVRSLVGLRRHQPLSLHTALCSMPLRGCPALLPHGARCVWIDASPSRLSPICFGSG
jgi:hypothetical protein